MTVLVGLFSIITTYCDPVYKFKSYDVLDTTNYKSACQKGRINNITLTKRVHCSAS